mmetsp:Transcript_27462/g.58019  ORF Transcript_27462/g.58019 Transcript_27462/m.58019 type:complete len:371 (-) Transcript_27462:261-1373(-)|eukprot:CAMPEP_0183709882 /NCGR_PEP_ID=MMETSP0737-20130205/5835_1 /TAXON_ID=385413 /ORGANISM="Thalassiosira miniscula, Strain CCMP1093" /LENGTH=370 /DNA_ID=CAMNT_0025938097 /DNA_START=49 /DNA_END=1161 /DNA_ORIENTATION=-
MAAYILRSKRAAVTNICALVPFTHGKCAKGIADASPLLRNLNASRSTSASWTITPLITSTNSYHRGISSTSYVLSKKDEGQLSASELHSLYNEQMKEIQSEREAIFGTTDDTSDGPDLAQTAKAYLSTEEDAAKSPTLPPNWNAEEAYAEREAIFAFSEEEKSAWSNNAGAMQLKSSHLHKIQKIMKEASLTDEGESAKSDPSQPNASPSPFSHLTPQGDGVSMVDVGHKTITRRVAAARTVVTFPPEVLSAFQVSIQNTEMIGPKGPIFETAKIAGIMGAKKTSDLIPLCHPLPLDRVNINIQLIDNRAIIECECRVTHKTGVEMEALTGATVAALTIYDMVKAVSHRVEIGQTMLVSKSGGKSDFVHN